VEPVCVTVRRRHGAGEVAGVAEDGDPNVSRHGSPLLAVGFLRQKLLAGEQHLQEVLGLGDLVPDDQPGVSAALQVELGR
jgi:hypothetical protein